MFTSLNMFWITLVLFVVCEAVDTDHYREPCPPAITAKNFVLGDYLGVWFEVARSYIPFEYGSKCTKFEYRLSGTGAVLITFSQIPSVPGVPSSINSVAAPNGEPNTAQWTVERSSYADMLHKQQWIVGTNYKYWSIEWSCTNIQGGSIQHARILTRERNPPGYVVQEAITTMNENGMKKFRFLETKQKNCPS